MTPEKIQEGLKLTEQYRKVLKEFIEIAKFEFPQVRENAWYSSSEKTLKNNHKPYVAVDLKVDLETYYIEYNGKFTWLDFGVNQPLGKTPDDAVDGLKIMIEEKMPSFELKKVRSAVASLKIGQSFVCVASVSRGCVIFKDNGKWYMALNDKEYDFEFDKATFYGPFNSEDEVEKELDRHSNPGGSDTYEEDGDMKLPKGVKLHKSRGGR